MEGMTVAEYIEYLKTLKQDYIMQIGDSEYPNEPLTKDSIQVNDNAKTYTIY